MPVHPAAHTVPLALVLRLTRPLTRQLWACSATNQTTDQAAVRLPACRLQCTRKGGARRRAILGLNVARRASARGQHADGNV
eukprot:361432-Chlamydomonas_euryale.AAC.9